MTSYSPSDSEDEHDRGRSGTSPLPADRCASQSLSRNQRYRKSLITQCSTSPVGLGFELQSTPSLKSKKVGLLKKHAARIAGTTLWPATSKRSNTPVTDKRKSVMFRSSCGNDDDINFPTPRWTRRRHRKCRKDKGPPKRRQWLVSAIITAVATFAWFRIFALVVHPPREGDRTMGSLLADDGIASVVSTGNNFDRRAGGVRKSLFSGEDEGSINLQSGMPATTRLGDSRTVSHGGGNQHPDLPLLNPRALEMVAADIGHLRNTIEQLENVLKESMVKHGKDISLVMRQLGSQRGTPTVKAEIDSTKQSKSKLFSGDPNDYTNEKRVPTEEVNWQQPQQPPNEQSSGAEAAVSPGFKNQEDVQKDLSGKSRGRQSPDVNSSRQERVRSGIRATRNDDDGRNLHTRGEWIKGQWMAKVFVDMSPPDTSQLVEEQRRVLLLSERRSGAGIVGKIFNADPNIFYVGDPCRMGGGPEALFGDVCSMMVSRLLACQPTTDDVRNLYSFSYIVEQSRALSQFKSYRVEMIGSPEENDELIKVSLAQLCGRSKVVMVKETRIAEVVPRVLMPELSIEFLLLVRDPRAALHGLSQSWERSKNELDRAMSKDCTQLAATICSSTEKKLESLINLGNDRFRVLKYETAAATPFPMTESIYAWLDLGNLPEEVSKALMNVSTEVVVPPPWGHAAEKERRAPLARFDWVTRWTVEMPDFRRHQIQRACKPLLASLRYEGAVGIGQRPGEIVGDGTEAADGVSSSDDSSGALDAWYGFVQVAAKVTAATSNTVPDVLAENVA